MPECTNPVQCQTASREECTCGCNGANHGAIRALLGDPLTKEAGEEKLKDLKVLQLKLKKEKSTQRRHNRAELKKSVEASTPSQN